MVRIFKNIGIGLFADGDSPMFQLAPTLSMFDVRCVHRPNSKKITPKRGVVMVT